MTRSAFVFRLLLLLALVQLAALPAAASVEEGKKLIRQAIEAHGQNAFGDASFAFSFRGVPYRVARSNGLYRYERTVTTQGTAVHEVLQNSGFTASVAGNVLTLSPRVQGSRERSLNSVVYFASLPYVLEDRAVQPRAVGEVEIGERRYRVVEVRFAREGGGVDHDDVFRYWFDAESGRLDYLAYRFHTNKGGVRFRVATEHPVVGGVTFIQWDNYGVDDKSLDLKSLPERWRSGKLPKLSTIRLDSIKRD